MVLPVEEKLLVFIRESKYDGDLPCFYDSNFFPELEPIFKSWQDIRDEVLEFERIHGSIKGIDTYSPPKLNSDTGWNNLYLENFMWCTHRNKKHFPITCSILDKIPNCTYSAISILLPGASILPHYGDTNGIIRCHLGLDIPEPYPVCGIRVGNEERGWANGKLTLFTEAHLHTTWNNSQKKRYVLVIDIVPSFFKEDKLDVCTKVLGAQTYNYFEKRIKILKKIPHAKLKYIHRLLTFFWRCYLPIQRKLKFL